MLVTGYTCAANNSNNPSMKGKLMTNSPYSPKIRPHLALLPVHNLAATHNGASSVSRTSNTVSGAVAVTYISPHRDRRKRPGFVLDGCRAAVVRPRREHTKSDRKKPPGEEKVEASSKLVETPSKPPVGRNETKLGSAHTLQTGKMKARFPRCDAIGCRRNHGEETGEGNRAAEAGVQGDSARSRFSKEHPMKKKRAPLF